MRKKILAFVFAAALLVAMAVPLFVNQGTAEATVHPLSQAECAKKQSQTGGGEDQDPPGISNESNMKTFARPIFAILSNPSGALTLDDHGSENPADWEWGGPAYSGKGEFHCKNPAGGSHPD